MEFAPPHHHLDHENVCVCVNISWSGSKLSVGVFALESGFFFLPFALLTFAPNLVAEVAATCFDSSSGKTSRSEMEGLLAMAFK